MCPGKIFRKKDRDWILYTEETPHVPVYSRMTLAEAQAVKKTGAEPSYNGTYVSAKRYVLDTFANTKSASMKRKVAHFLTSIPCPSCHGKRIKAEALSVTFAGVDIADFSQLPLHELVNLLDEEVQQVSKKLALDADGLDEENAKNRQTNESKPVELLMKPHQMFAEHPIILWRNLPLLLD